MKLTNLFLFAGAAYAAYKVIENKDQIMAGAEETVSVTNTITDQVKRLQENAARVQTELLHLQDVVSDLSYEATVFSKVAQAKVQTIQDIWNKPEEQ